MAKNEALNKLDGIYGLSDAQYSRLMHQYPEVFAKYDYDRMALDRVFRNQQFKDKYGADAFNKIKNPKQRDAIFKHDIINSEFIKKFQNTDSKGQEDNTLGLGNMFDYYNSRLSDDGKLELLKSEYKRAGELKKASEEFLNNTYGKGFTGHGIWDNMLNSLVGISPQDISQAQGAKKQNKKDIETLAKEQNQRILDNIYNKDIKRRTSDLSSEWIAEKENLLSLSDNQVEELYLKCIKPNSYTDKDGNPNLGIPELAARYNGKGKYNSTEVEDMTIDKKREIIAKKRVYDKYLPLDMAQQALNNEAKEYIVDHQGWFKKKYLQAKDITIKTIAYSADQLDGVAELGRLATDAVEGKQSVWINDKGEIVDTTKAIFKKDAKGNIFYKGEDGKNHYAHKEQISRTALHQMGKEADGSDIQGAFGYDFLTLNPKYWNRAEQYGTLDADLQKQYEKLGASPYQLSYKPGDDSDLLYEGVSMLSYNLADGLSMLLPYGIGATGKALSAASKVGKLGRGLGKVLSNTGKVLGNPTVRGLIGAEGIAFAYGRSSFMEDLERNYTALDEYILNESKKEVQERFNNDKQYRGYVKKLTQDRTNELYNAYTKDNGTENFSTVKPYLEKQAKQEVLNALIENKVLENKASKEFGEAQQNAIDRSSDVFRNVFVSEGIKYGLVNSLGPRKFLYKNPQGFIRKISPTLKGLREVTTKDGLKRLTTKTSKFLTNKQKLAELGKTVVSQGWGGFWTNGTDDMQVDAAERISEDSFNSYLRACQNGEAQADTYSFIEGVNSALSGLKSSLAQESTWRAGVVGALGSYISVTPNFTNIAHYFTKSGREAYRQNLRKKVKTDAETGEILKDESGNIQYEDLNKWDNWRERLSFFLSNGVLNTYYGKKQAERDVVNHAMVVNNLLDNFNDFKDVEKLIASNISAENVINTEDKNTQRFVNALFALKVLNNLGNNSKDPTTMSSVIQNTKKLIDKLNKTDVDKEEIPFSEEELKNILSEYYATNPGAIQSGEMDKEALNIMAKNAQLLTKATTAYNKALDKINKLEKNSQAPIDPNVKASLLVQQALYDHWGERKEKLRSELGDISPEEASNDPNYLIASLGGKKNALEAVKTYDRQLAEYEEVLKSQQAKEKEAEHNYIVADNKVEEIKNSEDQKGLTEAQETLKQAQAEYEHQQNQSKFIQDYITTTKEKRNSIEETLKENHTEENLEEDSDRLAVIEFSQSKLDKLEEKRNKLLKKNGKEDEVNELNKEIQERKEQLEYDTKLADKTKDPVLTADEILNNLDPVTRARMMRKENRELYSPEQKKEIEKAENTLLMQNPDALQKIQDIALLTQRMATAKDAYSRIVKNPEAAARALEIQNAIAIDNASGIIDHNNAVATAKIIKDFFNGERASLKKEEKDDAVYKALRMRNSSLLKILDTENLLPEYKDVIQKAKDWASVLEDITAVIRFAPKDESWKEQAAKNIDNIVETCNNREELLSALEKVIDDNFGTVAADDFDYILDHLKNLGYQRNQDVIESRKERKEREDAQRKAAEEKKARIEEEAKKKAEEEAKKQESDKVGVSQEENKEKKQKEQNDLDDNTPVDFNVDELEDLDLDDNTPSTSTGKPIPITPSINNDTSSDVGSSNSNLSTTDSKESSSKNNTWESSYNDYMSDSTGNGEENTGLVYTESPSGVERVPFIIRKKDNLITFYANNDNIALTVPSESIESSEEHKGKPFEMSSLEKKKDGWYARGNYKGEDSFSEVKVKDSFDLDSAINDYKESKEKELSSKQSTIPEDRIVRDSEGNIEGVKSPSLKDQQEELSSRGDSATIEDVNSNTKNAEEENAIVSDCNEERQEENSGMKLPRYEKQPLENEGILVPRKGRDPKDSMNSFFDWMDAAGIKYQNVVDHELARILTNNPHAKVKYMLVRPEYNATNDVGMQTHLLLVLDYDDSINKGITKIHDESNGGVLESKGKKYLVIGTLGFGNKEKASKEKQALYYNLMNTNMNKPLGLAIRNRKKYFEEHPDERFYVPENLHTEVIPGSIIPGYLVKQTLKDTTIKESQGRTLSELLEDTSRNPYHLTLNDIIFGIQEYQGFMLTGAPKVPMMGLKNALPNMGGIFALIPASNGKLIPIKLRHAFYTEIKNGELKSKIDNYIEQLLDDNYEVRFHAACQLGQYLYLDSKKDFFVIPENGDMIYVIHNGIRLAAINVKDKDFNKLRTAVVNMNPMINITMNGLLNQEVLKSYIDAGAIKTDVALLGTAGSAFNVYGLNPQGEMVIPNRQQASTGSEEVDRGTLVVYNHSYYKEKDGKFSLDGKEVTDSKTLEQLNYIKKVFDNSITPFKKQGVLSYYIMSRGEHPEVITINSNSKEVSIVEENKARELIAKYDEKLAEENRDQEAADTKENDEIIMDSPDLDLSDALDNTDNTLETPTDDNTIIDDTIDYRDIITEDTKENESISKEETPTENTKTNNLEVSQESGNSYDRILNTEIKSSSEGTIESKNTINFFTLCKNMKYKKRIQTILKEKGIKLENKNEIKKAIQDMGIAIDGIENTQEGIEAFLKTLEECR